MREEHPADLAPKVRLDPVLLDDDLPHVTLLRVRRVLKHVSLVGKGGISTSKSSNDRQINRILANH